MLRSALSRWTSADADLQIRTMLRTRLGAEHVSLHRSGREALRHALCVLAASPGLHSLPNSLPNSRPNPDLDAERGSDLHSSRDSGRDEVIVPAYTCYSVPAAVVAAGLKVRLVEVDLRGRIDPVAFSQLPLERAVAVVVCNLFGHCEPIRPWAELAEQAGVAVIDDAAQALGATSQEGAAGSRGAVGILSFGRGKPLSALGGGACAWHASRQEGATSAGVPCDAASTRPNAIRAIAAAALHDVALRPWVFRQLKRVPALGIGETHFDPDFARGSIHGESLALANAQLPNLDRDAKRRRSNALALAPVLKSAGYEPLTGDSDDTSVYPRLAVLAPNETLRNQAISALAKFGAGGLYPSAACDIEALRPQLATRDVYPVAAQLAARLFTMNTTRSYSPSEMDEVGRLLESHSA